MSLTFSLINDRNWTVTAAVQLQTHVSHTAKIKTDSAQCHQ